MRRRDVQLAHYLGLLQRANENLVEAYSEVADTHGDEPDVADICMRFSRSSARQAEDLRPFTERYGQDADEEPDRLHSDLFQGTRAGSLALLRDLHDVYLMATECAISWTVVAQAAQGARDRDLLSVAQRGRAGAEQQLTWIRSRMKQAAPQALVVT
jgi:hypothetical protein